MIRFVLSKRKIKYLGSFVSLVILMYGFAFAGGKDTVSFTYYKGKKELVIRYKFNKNHLDARAFIKKGTFPSLDTIISQNKPKYQNTIHYVDEKDVNYYKVLFEEVTISDKSMKFDTFHNKECIVYMMNGPFDQVDENARLEVDCKIEDEYNGDKLEGDTGKINVSQDTKNSNHTYWVWIVLFPLMASVFLIVIHLKNKKKTNKIIDPSGVKNTVLNKVENGIEEYVIGLDETRQHIDDYYMMDLQEVFTNTAVHKIYLHHTAVKKMYDFFKAALESTDQTTETGCYFVGCWEYDNDDKQSYNISLEDIVEPGDDIISDEYSFSFGGIIGIRLSMKISDLCQNTKRNYVHTVWMHSHPGLGLFLSEQDLLVQQLLTYSSEPNRLVAFVIDTNTPNWDLAVFTAKNDGTMNNKVDLKRIYSLEELYKWCRQVHTSVKDPNRTLAETPVAHKDELVVNPDDYYTIPIKHKEDYTNESVYLNGRTINAIDDIIYDYAGQNTLGGYLLGENDNYGNFRVDDCVRDTDMDTEPLGLFIVDSQLSNPPVASDFLKKTLALCVIVYRSDDDLLLLTRMDVGEPFPALSEATTCSIPSMKEWIRRRRVYK